MSLLVNSVSENKWTKYKFAENSLFCQVHPVNSRLFQLMLLVMFPFDSSYWFIPLLFPLCIPMKKPCPENVRVVKLPQG